MKQLYPVKLAKTDTCLTYCYKRLGWKQTHKNHKDVWFLAGIVNSFEKVTTDHERLEDNFDLIPLDEYFYDTVGTFEVGDLLLFSHREKQLLIPDIIDENGNIHYTTQIIRRHVAVYEGDDIVSHALFGHSSDLFESTTAMQIEKRALNDFKYPPTHLLRLKTS